MYLMAEEVNVKKKIMLMIAAGVLVSATVFGGTFASFNAGTEGGVGTAIAKVTTKAISVAITGEGTTNQAAGAASIVPGTDSECSYNVYNDVTGEDAYDIYVKVTIYKKWQSKGLDGKYVSLKYNHQNKSNAYQTVADTSQMYLADNDWIVAYADDEQVVLYYTKPLAKEEHSTNFVDQICFNSQIDNTYANTSYALEYEVNAVQVSSGEDAMASEWGVFPLFDSNGNITGVYETRAERDSIIAQ